MFGVNEDEYWYNHQKRHDPQWYDSNDCCGDSYDERDEADMQADEMILARGAYED